jgi:hypothetical protein
MNKPFVILLVLGVALVGEGTRADNELVQVGYFSFPRDPKETGQPLSVDYTDIKFPTPFGSVPTVVIPPTLSIDNVTINRNLENITPEGFRVRPEKRVVVKPLHEWAGIWIAVGPPGIPVLHGTVTPKYLVLTVVYAAPGNNGGKNTSSVVYQAGSTTGVTTSAKQSFKVGNSLSIEAQGGILGSVGSGFSFDYARNTTDAESLDIKKSTTSTIQFNGPSKDGVDHDHDAIYLWLSPTIDLALTPSTAQWALTATQNVVIQYVYVGWLNNHVPMPDSIAQALQQHGITPEDFPDILQRDPLANGATSLDPRRFVPLNTTFPYEPPYSASDSVPSTSYNVSNSSISGSGSTIEDSYKVGLSISAEGGFLGIAKVTLKDTLSWAWTNESSQSTSVGRSESASVTVGGPAFGYSGSTIMQVYFDTLYRTFAFAPIENMPLGLKGTLMTAQKKPQISAEVTLLENGVTYRTFTNRKGEYRFFGNVGAGPAKLQANGVTEKLPQLQQARSVQLQLK